MNETIRIDDIKIWRVGNVEHFEGGLDKKLNFGIHQHN